MEEFGYFQKGPSIIFSDNRAAIVNTSNDSQRLKIKHLDIKYMFIRNQVILGLLKCEYIPTDQNKADLGTKDVVASQFKFLRNGIGIRKLLGY